MFENKNILVVIPARGGSKGIPLKNLKEIGDRSLMEWALFTALQSELPDRIIVSSDSDKIIQRANSHGDFAPFVRPGELAQDNSASLPVFQHAHSWAEKADDCIYDYLVALEPTCPFRLSEHIHEGVSLAVKSNASSVMSLVEVGDHHPVRIKRLSQNGSVLPFCIPEPEGLRRQDQEPAFIRNCAVLVFSRETLIKNHLWGDAVFGFIMKSEYYSINIDEPLDLATAGYLYDQLNENGKLNMIDSTRKDHQTS